MQGLYGKTHFELEQYVDMDLFEKIQVDIWQGIATGKPLADHGYLIPIKLYQPGDLSTELKIRPLMDAYQEFISLPSTDILKVRGELIYKEHGYNALATFLKYAYGAHDLCSHYLFWDHHAGWRDNTEHRKLLELASHFPTLINWIDKLVTDGIFSNIGRAYIIAIDSNGHSFEHRDPPLDPDVGKDVPPEFIHIRPNLKRPFYVYDPETKTKHYINSRVGWWNDRDVHGGEVIHEPSYAIRIDGIFTDAFREKITCTS